MFCVFGADLKWPRIILLATSCTFSHGRILTASELSGHFGRRTRAGRDHATIGSVTHRWVPADGNCTWPANAAGRLAIYGDATRQDILETAGITEAKYLLATIPDLVTRTLVILTAKQLNPALRVFARARYLQERAWLEEVGATAISIEEAETALGLAVLLLREVGADESRILDESRRIQSEFNLRPDPVVANSDSNTPQTANDGDMSAG